MKFFNRFSPRLHSTVVNNQLLGSFPTASLVGHHLQQCLHQKILILNTITCTDYTKKHASFFRGSTVGGHMRHSLDHISKVMFSLKNGCEHEPNIISYDQRDRNTEIENNRSKTIECVDKIIHDLALTLQRNPEKIMKPIVVKFISDADTGTEYDIPSSIERELSFAAHHATHHIFIMSMMLETMGYKIDSSIGVANSTLKFSKQVDSCTI